MKINIVGGDFEVYSPRVSVKSNRFFNRQGVIIWLGVFIAHLALIIFSLLASLIF